MTPSSPPDLLRFGLQNEDMFRAEHNADLHKCSGRNVLFVLLCTYKYV